MKTEKKNNGRTRKVRSDSVLDGLPAQKQEALNRWLFEENLSYREVKRRLEEEFGIKTAENSLVAYYRRQALEGRFEKMAGAMGHAKDFVIGYECVESIERAVTQLLRGALVTGHEIYTNTLISGPFEREQCLHNYELINNGTGGVRNVIGAGGTRTGG